MALPDVFEHLGVPGALFGQDALLVALVAPVTGEDIVLDQADELIVAHGMLLGKVHPGDLPTTAIIDSATGDWSLGPRSS